MKSLPVLIAGALVVSAAQASPGVSSRLVPFAGWAPATQIELKNDNYNEAGGQAFVQQGFVSGEKAGVWVKVPSNVPQFKVDYFRVLVGGGAATRDQVFFQMGIANQVSPSMPADIENAASITAGAYWNDIPAQGSQGGLRCAKAGELIGASLEFTHDGLPSVYRAETLSNPKANTLFAIPGGWNYSVAYGLQGDWILRVIGHAAKTGECP